MKIKVLFVYIFLFVSLFNIACHASQAESWAKVGRKGQYLTVLDKQVLNKVAEHIPEAAQHYYKVKKRSYYVRGWPGLITGLAAVAYVIRNAIKMRNNKKLSQKLYFL